MKESLLAPIKSQQKSMSEQNTKQSSGSRDYDNKYKGLLGFGTPNIRPCKRMKHMNQNQIKSHLNLQKLWGGSAAGGKSTQDEERDSNNFKKASASDFFKRTRAAEMELKNKHQRDRETNNNEELKSNGRNKKSVKNRLMNLEC